MLNTIFIFLLKTILDSLAAIFLLRFYLQTIRAPYQNPLSHNVFALTDFAIKPLRRFIPSFKKIDSSTLVAAFIAQLLLYSTLLLTHNIALFDNEIITLLLFTVAGLIKISLYIVIILLLVYVILSWVLPHNPISEILTALTRPLLNPIRKRIPPINHVDLSPLIVGLLAQILLIVLSELVPLSL